MTKERDVVIAGGGPAGLTAGIYCSRAGLDTLLFERTAVGGQILKADIVENYPGFAESISGFELMEKMKRQAEKFGVTFENSEINGIEFRGAGEPAGRFEVNADAGQKYRARAIIIATGANPKTLGVKGEAELYGKGVSYCATCDGPLFRNKDIVVIGGGDAAVGEAIYLARFAKKLTLVHRRDQLRAARILQERLLKEGKIEMRLNCVPSEILGSGKVSSVKIKDIKSGNEQEIPAAAVFIYIGVEPKTDFLKGKIELSEQGFIITDEEMRTSVKGIFACGDVRKNALKQVVTACAEGAVAAHSCRNYIEEL